MTENLSAPDLSVRLRHSSAHVMARAVLDLFPRAHIGFGPATADGFYYDFATDVPITEDDLTAIETRMRQIITDGEEFVFRSIDYEDARRLFADQPFKLEIAEEIAAGNRIDVLGARAREGPVTSDSLGMKSASG